LSSIAHLLTRIDIVLCYTTFVKIIKSQGMASLISAARIGAHQSRRSIRPWP
jgi:hypothetical protein